MAALVVAGGATQAGAAEPDVPEPEEPQAVSNNAVAVASAARTVTGLLVMLCMVLVPLPLARSQHGFRCGEDVPAPA